MMRQKTCDNNGHLHWGKSLCFQSRRTLTHEWLRRWYQNFHLDDRRGSWANTTTMMMMRWNTYLGLKGGDIIDWPELKRLKTHYHLSSDYDDEFFKLGKGVCGILKIHEKSCENILKVFHAHRFEFVKIIVESLNETYLSLDIVKFALRVRKWIFSRTIANHNIKVKYRINFVLKIRLSMWFNWRRRRKKYTVEIHASDYLIKRAGLSDSWG